MVRCVSWSLVLLLTLALARTASAQESPADKAKAKTFFAAGKKLFLQKRYAEASDAFKQAYQHRKHRVILYNIALALAMAGKPVDALPYLKQYQRQPSPKDPPLDEALRRVPELVGTLIIVVTNPRAEIYVDGRRVGTGRVELVTEPGQKAVDVRLDQKVVATRIVEVVGGKEKMWEITPQVETRQPPVSPDRQVERRTSPPSVTATPTTPTRPPTRGLGRLHWAWFTAVAVVAAGAAGGAAAFSVKNKEAYDAFLKDRSNAQLRADGVQYQKLSNVMWGASAALATTAVVLALFTRWRKREQPSSLILLPTVGPGSVGLAVTVSR